MRSVALSTILLLWMVLSAPADSNAGPEMHTFLVPAEAVGKPFLLTADASGIRIEFLRSSDAPSDQGCITQPPAVVRCTSGPHHSRPKTLGIEGYALAFSGGSISTTAGDGYVRCTFVPPISMFTAGVALFGSCEKLLATIVPYAIEGSVEAPDARGGLFHFAIHED